MAYMDPQKARNACRRFRAKDPEAERARCREYYRKNRLRLLARQKARNQTTRARVRTKSGLPIPTRPSPEFCELCGRLQMALLALDHDHATGKFRGWLCHQCNTGIGKLGDSIAGLKRALRYLGRNT